jgi:prolyl oligopeptidase
MLVPALLLGSAAAAAPISYPETATVPQADVFHGERVPDPYRWLENDVRTDAKVADWVTAQNRVTDAYLATLPARDTMKARLTELWNYERFGIPRKRGTKLFYTRNSGLQNQAVLYVQDGDAPARALIDPNPWAKDGATALAEWEPSPDGRHLAYGVQDGGTDWRTLKVRDTITGQDLADSIEWAKYSEIAWKADGSGFYYSRYAAPAQGKFTAKADNHQVYFHRLGTPQSADRLIYETPETPGRVHTVDVTDDGRWLVISSFEGAGGNAIHLADIASGEAPRPLVTSLANEWVLAGSQGDELYLRTNNGASRGRILAKNARTGAERLVVPEGPGTITGAALTADRLVVETLNDAKSVVRLHAPDGQVAGTVPLPGIGTAYGFEGGLTPESYFAFSSFNRPTTIFRLDTRSNAVEAIRQPKVAFNPDDFVVTQRFFTSKDGTRVPMFVSHRKGLDLSKPQPTLLYGYGGFNVSETPRFSVSWLGWMDMGGVFVLANIRGGGEYGKAWHDAGRGANKQNVFDDFIAAGEALVRSGVTTPSKLAVQGGSNGGLLVGAVVNQRPELFAAALPLVGVMDMLRYNQFTAGRFWVEDYGDPAKPDDFRALRSYSPYHNVGSGKPYPAILVMTADTDDRVVPGHSFKYAAALQAADIGDRPHLIRIETRAGHGSGKPTDKAIAEAADMWAFIGHWTGLTKQPAN